MRIKINAVLLMLAGITISFTACRQAVGDEVPEFEKTPVVNSLLISGSPLKVHLSFAQKLDNTDLELVDNANVDMYKDGIFLERLQYTQAGEYQSSTTVLPDATYSCKIKIPGFDTIYASAHIPDYPNLISTEMILEVWMDEEGMKCPAIVFSFKNNPEEKLYFEALIKSITNDWDSDRKIANIVSMFPNITDPLILNEGLLMPVFSNELIPSNEYQMQLIFDTGGASKMNDEPWIMDLDPTVLELRAISKDYYIYAKQLALYEKGRYPYGFGDVNRVFNLHSNVQNAQGIFAGYSFAVSDTIFPNDLNQ